MSYTQRSTFATLPRTKRGVPIVLNGDPMGKNFLYTNGNSVIIRELANPTVCDIYTEHSTTAIVAKYSPSGYYIASGDSRGKVRIWDTTQKEHLLKNEFQPLSGAIKDLDWSEDSKRIVAVGEGREKFGHVFNAETGTSVGEICGHSKSLNSAAYRPTRPYAIATAGEDNLLSFFRGPPFKFDRSMKDHANFVNVVRYAPDGSAFISGGADGRSFIYDGKTGELTGQLGDPAHKGGIYGLSFSADSRQCLTVSADKTAKIWDVEAATVVTEFKMGSTVEDMQVGCLWEGDFLLTVSLSGYINYLDRNNPDKPLRVIRGHNKPITALALNEDKSQIYTGASDGKVFYWDVNTGESDLVTGKGHSNQVQALTSAGNTLISCGFDDTIVYTDTNTNEYGTSIKMPSQPRDIASADSGLVVVACINEVVVVRDKKIVYSHKVSCEPQSIAINPGQTEVAVGGNDRDMKVHIFTLDRDTLSDGLTLDHAGTVTSLAYSPDGSQLAAADSNRRLILYKVAEGYTKVLSTDWCTHTARLTSVDWTPDSQHLGTGALDTNVIAWSPSKPQSQVIIKGAHLQYLVNHVRWLDNNNIVSVGQDSNVKVWTISEFA